MQENIDINTFSELFFNASKLESNNNVNREYRGKGPYYLNQDSEVVYDLNPFSNRYSLLGYGHPLKIKSDLVHEETNKVMLEKKIKDSFLPDQNIYIKFTTRSRVSDNSVLTMTSFNKINTEAIATTGIFGIGNYWYKRIEPLLQKCSKILVQNFLPLDFYILRNKDVSIDQSNINPKELFYTNLTLNYFLKAPFYIEGGRFDQINQLLKDNFNESFFQVQNLFVFINKNPKKYLPKLKKMNILAGAHDNKIILSFPTAILEEHIANVHKTIIECLKEGNE